MDEVEYIENFENCANPASQGNYESLIDTVSHGQVL